MVGTRLEGHMRELIDGQITSLSYFERVRESLKPSVIRMALLGAGGVNSATASVYGAAGSQLRKVYSQASSLIDAILEGRLTERQALQRSRDLSLSVNQIFHRTEQLQRASAGFQEAWRRLDPGSVHCPECISYSTGGWVSLEEVVPIGSSCSCGGRCRCTIAYRKVPSGGRSLQSSQILSRQIQLNQQRGEPEIDPSPLLASSRGG